MTRSTATPSARAPQGPHPAQHGGHRFPAEDAQSDFARARRSRMLADLGRRLRFEPDDVGYILPFEEVVRALGWVGQRSQGLQSIPLESIVGTVDRSKEFDRAFRPTGRVRGRWQRIAEAQRRGRDMPPISVYRVGDLHFVRDGHHRVSVARAQGRSHIDAYVTDVETKVPIDSQLRPEDLPLKGHERLFRERVPLSPEARVRVRPSDPWDYGSWRRESRRGASARCRAAARSWTAREVARLWFDEDYKPVTEMLRRGRAGRARRDRDRRLHARSSSARYLLLRTHEWSDEVLERLRSAERRRKRRTRMPPRRRRSKRPPY